MLPQVNPPDDAQADEKAEEATHEDIPGVPSEAWLRVTRGVPPADAYMPGVCVRGEGGEGGQKHGSGLHGACHQQTHICPVCVRGGGGGGGSNRVVRGCAHLLLLH